jgi:signal transduction histidine kinase
VQWYTRAKLREVERQLEKQRSIEAIRTRISRDIHDEIGAGLTKISLMSRKVERLAKTNDEAGEAASGLGNASRDLVQNLGEIVWTINPKNDSLADLLGYLRSYTGKFFEETGIALHLQVTEILPAHHAMRLSPEVKRNTLLILKESLNNVVKHSEATNVSVEVTLQDEQFCLVIEDNGRGFDLEMRSRSGNGLRNMQKRAEEIQGEYEVKTSVSNGTCTMLKFRLKTLAGA